MAKKMPKGKMAPKKQAALAKGMKSLMKKSGATAMTAAIPDKDGDNPVAKNQNPVAKVAAKKSPPIKTADNFDHHDSMMPYRDPNMKC